MYKKIEVVHFHLIGPSIALLMVNSIERVLQYDINMKMTILGQYKAVA